MSEPVLFEQVTAADDSSLKSFVRHYDRAIAPAKSNDDGVKGNLLTKDQSPWNLMHKAFALQRSSVSKLVAALATTGPRELLKGMGKESIELSERLELLLSQLDELPPEENIARDLGVEQGGRDCLVTDLRKQLKNGYLVDEIPECEVWGQPPSSDEEDRFDYRRVGTDTARAVLRMDRFVIRHEILSVIGSEELLSDDSNGGLVEQLMEREIIEM